MSSTMKHNSETGELICYAPVDEEVLRIVEPDFEKAFAIAQAIQTAFNKGHRLGRLRLQRDLEMFMDRENV